MYKERSAPSITDKEPDAWEARKGRDGNQTLRCYVQCMHCTLRGIHLHNMQTEIFSSHPQQSLLLSRGKQIVYLSKINGCPLVLRVRVLFLFVLFFVVVVVFFFST